MNITLIGMPGSGKSTLGLRLAEALKMKFIDTDLLIEKREGLPLQEILDTQGVDGFLRIEEEVLLNLRTDNSVISTGGSAVYSPPAMAHLRQSGPAVYLSVPYPEIESRLDNLSTRGVVIKPNSNLRKTYDEREPLYQQYADLTIRCSTGDEDRCVAEIASALGSQPRSFHTD